MAGDKVDSFLPLFGRDFIAATIGWTAEERGHYVVLLITQWEQGCISADPARLELASPGLGKCWELLGDKFPICADGVRRNQRLEEHREKATSLAAVRKSKAEAAARARWDASEDAPSNAPSNATSISQAMPQQCPPSPSPSPSPSSNSSLCSEVATSVPPKRRTRTQPTASVSWSADAGWQGITDEDRQEWRTAYPACDLTAELAKAASWLKGNPAKAHRSNWRRFLVAWLTRSQDRGGSNRTPNARASEQTPTKAWGERPAYRAEYQRSMTDAEYARAKQGKHGMVAALAESIGINGKE